MRKLSLIGGSAVAIAIGIALWQTRERAPTAPNATARLEAPVAGPAAAPPRAAAPSRADRRDPGSGGGRGRASSRGHR